MKIKIHSVIDLITNSSTEIFTYSNSSDTAMKEMINELFKSFNIDKTCDDVFNVVVLAESYDYKEYLGELFEREEDAEGFTDENFEAKFKEVETCLIPKPKWFFEAEKQENYDGFSKETYLNISPKFPEYQNLAKLIRSFLYSTYHEATYNG